MNEQETAADIIAEMRFHGQQNIDAEKDKPEYGILTVEGRIAQNYADRLEAAHERERGDAAKLREALEALLNLAYEVEDMNSDSGPRTSMPTKFVIDTAKSAISAPPRNCDVGTAMEQGERFSAYCRAHKHPESECLLCPLFGQTGGHCELAWAQLPYEVQEGGAK